MKIRITLLDDNAKFLDKITNALTVKYPDKVEMHSFTNKEDALSSINKNRTDVFVAGDSFDVNPADVPAKCAFAYFVDSDDIESLADCKTISRYQRVDDTFNKIQKLYLENSAAIISTDDSGRNSVKVVCFVSAAGGVGCSTAAAAYAARCAKLGKKVLYLNLDCFASADVFFEGEGDGNIGNMIYYIKSRKVNLALKHDGIVKRDDCGVDFYSPSKIALDMKELTNEEIREFVAQLKTWGGYDEIVVDGYSDLNKDFIAFLNTCNLVIMVTDGSETANLKTERCINAVSILEQKAEMNVLSKFGILYNRFSTKTSHKVDFDNINEIGGIKRYEGYDSSRQLVAEIVRESRAFDTIV